MDFVGDLFYTVTNQDRREAGVTDTAWGAVEHTAYLTLACSCLPGSVCRGSGRLSELWLWRTGEGDSLKHNAFALVVHERVEPCESLKPVLRRFGVDTFSVHSCADASRLLAQTHPHLIFTDTQLPDGSWIDLVNIAEDAAVPMCVIVVGPAKDPEMLLAASHNGAFSFISPPFDDESISRVVNGAMTLVSARRERHSQIAAAEHSSAA